MANVQFPDWWTQWRPYQEEAVDEIVEHFEYGDKLVLLSAPVGSGKSLIAEVVRQRLETSGIYLCTTKSLQTQFAEDFPWSKVIKGRANYTPLLAQYDPYEKTTPSCADCEGENCSLCPTSQECPYPQAKQAAIAAALPVANTSYFLGEVSGGRAKFGGRGLVILDEADMLESEIMRFVSVSISPRMQRLLHLDPPKKKTVQASWLEWLDYATKHIRAEKRHIPSMTIRGKRQHEQVKRLLDRLDAINKDPEGWVYDGWGYNHIEFKPVRVDALAPQMLWPHGQRFLAMSGTIDPVEEFVATLGWTDDYKVVRMPSSFPMEHRPVKYIPVAKVTKKNEDIARPQLVAGVQEVLTLHEGERVLVLPHSYALARYIEDNLDVDRPVFCYHKADERDDAIAAYDETEGSVLIAASLGRGWNGIEDRCRAVIICKVPYPYLGDKQVSARLRSKGGELWYAGQASRSIQQMVGRGVRSEDDKCSTYILDESFGSFYRKWRRGDTHQLFSQDFRDSIVWQSDENREVKLRARHLAASA